MTAVLSMGNGPVIYSVVNGEEGFKLHDIIFVHGVAVSIAVGVLVVLLYELLFFMRLVSARWHILLIWPMQEFVLPWINILSCHSLPVVGFGSMMLIKASGALAAH